MSRMKALAHGLLWWPLLDWDIEDAVKHCISCQQNQAALPPANLQTRLEHCSELLFPWMADEPWELAQVPQHPCLSDHETLLRYTDQKLQISSSRSPICCVLTESATVR